MQRLGLKMVVKYNILPTSLILEGVRCNDFRDRLTGGSFADVYSGTFGGLKVALKVLRVSGDLTEEQKQRKTQVSAANSRLPYMKIHDVIWR